jgi:hypothetical protein
MEKSKKIHTSRHLLPAHLTIQEFADKKGVRKVAVYTHIKAGKIILDKIGLTQTKEMIDWNLYKGHYFAPAAWTGTEAERATRKK